MDLYAERQCIDRMKEGDTNKILILYDAYFDYLYKYVLRRVGERINAERIVRLVMFDALGQIPGTPVDTGYLVWLYSLARPRVWEYLNESGFPQKSGLISVDDGGAADSGTRDEKPGKAEKMFAKLSLEEREILRLKFFEEVSDGDVMVVLGGEDGSIGPRIYRVLKRAHLLLFGENDERQGVYFGELSGFFEGVRAAERLEVPGDFKSVLRTEISIKISQKDFAINGDGSESADFVDGPAPFEVKSGPAVERAGSNDPAKIFVKAAKEMQEEEVQKFEKREKFFDFFDRWKHVLVAAPVFIFMVVISVVVLRVADFYHKIERGYPTTCGIEIAFEGDFSDVEMRNVNRGVSDRLCDHFEVSRLLISRTEKEKVEVEVDVTGWFLEYGFVQKSENWRIKRYARSLSGNGESGEVS